MFDARFRPATASAREAVVIGKAEALAAAAVRGLGADYCDLKSVSTDVDNIKIRRRNAEHLKQMSAVTDV
ncbi:hypothetical protein [Micromonospora sp. NPDC005367]|uniref:hypothetical protein n=1 Tax=Micromonospora sp. NPDC005367 TaxID=3155590 RepID=UPI0033A21A53